MNKSEVVYITNANISLAILSHMATTNCKEGSEISCYCVSMGKKKEMVLCITEEDHRNIM